MSHEIPFLLRCFLSDFSIYMVEMPEKKQNLFKSSISKWSTGIFRNLHFSLRIMTKYEEYKFSIWVRLLILFHDFYILNVSKNTLPVQVVVWWKMKRWGFDILIFLMYFLCSELELRSICLFVQIKRKILTRRTECEVCLILCFKFGWICVLRLFSLG